MIFSTLLLCYLAFAIVYVAANPRVVVSGMFYAIDVPPSYAQHVASSMLDQASLHGVREN